MKAFEIRAPQYSTIVIGEGWKSCPLYSRSEWEKDEAATLAFDNQGNILLYCSAAREGARFTMARAHRVPMPEWAKRKQGGNDDGK